MSLRSDGSSMDEAERKRLERQHFDTAARGESRRALKYDQMYLDYLTYEALSLIGPLAGRRILLYGCGRPRGSRDFLAPTPASGLRTVMIDLSFESIKNQARRVREMGAVAECAVLQMDCEHLALREHVVDGVYGRAILHHLALDQAAREIARVLKPGGRAVFMEPLNGNPIINLFRRLTPRWRTPTEHPLSFNDIDQLRRYFREVTHVEAGLTAVVGVALNELLQQLGIAPVSIRPLLKLDRFLLSRAPRLRRLCWSTLITLET